MKLITSLAIVASLYISLNASDIEQLAKELNLYAGTKATIQWERVFSSMRHMKRYKIDSFSQETRDQLREYLIEHAADSDQPIVPGL